MKRRAGAELSLGEPIQGTVNSLSSEVNCQEHPLSVGASWSQASVKTPAKAGSGGGKGAGEDYSKEELWGIADLLKTRRLKENRSLVLQLLL